MKKFSFKFSLLLTAVILSFLANSCKDDPVAPVNNENYIGIVVDEQGTPVPGAELQIILSGDQSAVEGLNAVSDENGNFSIKKAKNNTDFSILIKHPDFELYKETLAEFEVKLANPIVLLHKGDCNAFLRIRININYNQKEIPGVEVRLERDGNLVRKDTTKIKDVDFRNICSGLYKIRINFYGCKEITDTLTLFPTDSLTKSYSLVPEYQDSCCDGKVLIIVRDKNTGKDPIYPPKISLFHGYSIKAEGIGSSLYLQMLCKSYYYIRITATDYDTVNYHYFAGCNEFDTLIFELTRQNKIIDSCCYGKINIEVSDSISGKAISNVGVHLYKNNNYFKSINTNSNGLATFYSLCPGNYKVSFTSDEWLTKVNSPLLIDLACNDSVTRKVKMYSNCCHGQITIEAIDSVSRKTIDGVNFSWDGYKNLGSGVTKNGSIIISKLCQGDLKITNNGKKGFFMQFQDERKISMDCDDSSQVTFVLMDSVLCCNGKISGIVTEIETGKPLSNVKLILEYSFKDVDTVYSDSEGKYRFENVCHGFYYIQCSKDGYQYSSVNVRCKCSETVNNINLILKPN